ncbi:MAG: DUF371 domain-containing protein [Promethearchaeota archaeon]
MPDKATLLEEFFARGHENVLSTHNTTVEFTKDEHLTKRGDCIIGIAASLSPVEFKAGTRELLRALPRRHFLVELNAGSFTDRFDGWGDPLLSLDNSREMVFRKSNFISGRTVLINCNKAAADIDRNLVDLMKSGIERVNVKLFLLP